MMPPLLFEAYGYLAIFAGTFIEGETILAMGGFAAQRGYLDLPVVVAVGLSGGFLGDQLYLFLGRRHDKALLVRFPGLARRAARLDEWMYRYHFLLIIGIRFMYGFRIAGPLVFGMGRVSVARFAMLNLLGACIWTFLVAGSGFLFGHGMKLLLPDATRYEFMGLGILAFFGLLLWVIRCYRTHRSSPPPAPNPLRGTLERKI